ncbi:MAG: hypothetical protein OEV22_16145 [Deltaproteobacteria bacterium]|jgi:hypothetical protein|nr:hypothetical protein [Deltaproteobacteria bacterium]
MKKDKTTTFGREYFLESLPVEWDEKLDGPRESQRKKKGDVKVSHADLAHLKALGLVRSNHTPVG